MAHFWTAAKGLTHKLIKLAFLTLLSMNLL